MPSAFFLTMPMTSLSGFGTPISRMLFFVKTLSHFNPLRHIVLLPRSICLHGISLDVLWPNMLFMAGLAFLMLSVSILRFRKTLG